MISKKTYHKAYLKKYTQPNNIRSNKNNNIIFLVFVSLPFTFTFFLNLLLNINDNEARIASFDKYNNFPSDLLIFEADDVIYNNIVKSNALDNKIKKNSDTLFKDNYVISKFEEVNQDYRNNLLNVQNKFVALKKVTLTNNSSSLKKISIKSNISEKKKEFINIVLPIIVDQNQNIIVLRQRLIDSKNYLIKNKTLSQSDQILIKNLASKYSISIKNRHKIDIIKDLLISIDIIPNSIALAQAANESGWGSSRFATEFNALFGEYTFDNKNGVVPFEREEGEKHLVKYFTTIDKSVESYFININSHSAYNKFRQLRKILRDNKTLFSASLLINKLDVYAKDKDYVNTLISIINDNKLTQYDNIILFTKS